MPYPRKRAGLTSTCGRWHTLQRPSELLSQPSDEIFSITIAAPLREEGDTDLDPLLCSWAVIVCLMTASDIWMYCCQVYFPILITSCCHHWMEIRVTQIKCGVPLDFSMAHHWKHHCDKVSKKQKTHSRESKLCSKACSQLQIKDCCCDDNSWREKICVYSMDFLSRIESKRDFGN